MDIPHQQVMNQVTGLQIKEKVRAVEAITALIGQEVEMANKYNIFNQDGTDQLFYAVEKTDFCTRQLKQCCNDCAAWNVDIFYTQGGRSDEAFKLHRDFTFTFCCLNRPVVEVNTFQGQKIGSLSNPCTFCNLAFDVLDTTGNPRMKVNGGCCQLGLCCPCPCGPCAEVHFDIQDKSGAVIGSIKKRLTCCKWFMADDADNYHVDFKGVTDAADKILIMGAAIFMDFRYFNNNQADGQQGASGDVIEGLLGGQ